MFSRLSCLFILVVGLFALSACSGGSGGGTPPPPAATYTVSGTVSGLAGTGLVVQNNGGDDKSISGNGSFSFSTQIVDGESYAVTVLNHPSSPTQLCTVTNGSGTISGTDVTNVNITCVHSYTISGTVSGLSGSGLVLQNNGGDDKGISASGSFSFSTPVTDGGSYSVSVLTQPTGLNQTCTVTNGSGTITGADITNVSIVCVTNTYSISGTVSGLIGSGLVLQNNGGDNTSISASGSFSFSIPVADGSSYSITVLTQPTGLNQTCAVTNGSGSINGADVTNVSIVCVINTYSIRGTVSGLNGSGLVLQNNGGDDKTISGVGTFSFATPIADGSSYAVSVLTQPTSPDQTCTVTQGSGTVTGADVTNVSVTCAEHYDISGTVSGLIGTGLVLQNNGGDNQSISADGSFSFSSQLVDGASYSVSILSQPSSPIQQCTVTNGSGTVSGTNVTTVDVTCLEPPTLKVSSLPGLADVSWNDSGAASYDLYRSTDPNCDFTNIYACADGTLTIDVTSPANVTGLSNGTLYYFVLKANYADSRVWTSVPGAARPDSLATDGPVNDIAVDASDTAYLGGQFTEVSARVGGGVLLSQVNSALAGDFPLVAGIVKAVVSDGSNGFYIGGTFSSVGGVARGNLAHILADGSVDPNWAPSANSWVSAIAVSGGTVYVGGQFNQVDGLPRNRLAAIDSAGTVTAWAPSADNEVFALAVSGGVVFVGGKFANINAIPNAYLAAIDSAGVLTTGSPSADNVVYALTASGSTIYVGGNFTAINGTTRSRLAALDSAGSLTTWAPTANNIVYSLLVSGSTVYVGGAFFTINGTTRSRLAALDSAGSLTTWAPMTTNVVRTMVLSGDTVYVGGGFDSVNGIPRNRLAAIDTSGTLTSWAPSASYTVNALAISSGAVYAGGDFTTINGTPRNYLAAINSAGELTSWAPDSSGSVNSLALSGTTLYVGGSFSSINGTTRSRLAAINTVGTGTLTSWAPSAGSSVDVVVVSGNVIYVAGSFTTIDGVSRTRLAAIGSDGTLTTWAPTPDSTVFALAVSGGSVYLGGWFNSINGTPRSNLAAVESVGTGTGLGALTSWAPSYNSTVNALAVSGSTVYVGGNSLVAIDATTGVFSTTWTPSVNGVTDIVISGGTFYVCGTFLYINSVVHPYLGAVDSAGALLTSVPSANWIVSTLAVSGGALYIGGGMRAIGTEAFGYFAKLVP